MEKLKAMFKKLIDKIKGIFGKDKEPPLVRETPVIPPFDQRESDNFWREHDEMSKEATSKPDVPKEVTDSDDFWAQHDQMSGKKP